MSVARGGEMLGMSVVPLTGWSPGSGRGWCTGHPTPAELCPVTGSASSELSFGWRVSPAPAIE